VRGLRRAATERIVSEQQRRPFRSLDDFVERVGLHRDEVRRLGEIGALSAFGLTRRGALWQVERACRPTGPLFRGGQGDAEAAPLPEMTGAERLASDLSGTGLTVGPHPMILYRPALAARDVKRATDLAGLGDGQRVTVAGAVICRQRPGTAKGFLFLTLEDETGLVNVTVRPDLYGRKQALLVGAGLLEIDGVLQTREGISLRALEARPLAGGLRLASRDFR
jgi:error-prone DNA polymerase